MQSPEQLAREKIDHSRVYSTNQISLSQLLWHHEKRPEEAMTDSLDIRNSTFGLCPIQRLYSMLREFVFVFSKMCTAGCEQHEQTGIALCEWHKAQRPHVRDWASFRFRCCE